MPPLTKPLKAEAPKVRVRTDLYATITRIAEQSPAGLGLNRTAIVDQALELWLAHRDGRPEPTTADAFATPHGEREQRLVSALLLFLRDKSANELHPVVEVLLRPWIEKVAKKHAHTSQRNTA